MCILNCSNIEKVYNKTDFKLTINNFIIDSNKIVGIIGPNGSGKSTLIKLITNLISLDKGQIQILGIDHFHKESRKHLGYLPETFSFPQYLSVENILKYYGYLEKNWNSKEVYKYIQTIITELNINYKKKRADNLSKGMFQTLGIAHILSVPKKIYILDEPFNGLDAIQKENIINLLNRKKNKENATIIFTSHILSDVDKICDHIYLIKDGMFLENNSTSYIKEAHNSVEDYYLEKFKI